MLTPGRVGGYPQPADDVKVVNALTKQLISQDGKKVILIGHSSGGFTATLAATPELQAKNQTSERGGIIGIFYACGFMVPVGKSVYTSFNQDGSPPVIPPCCKFHKHGIAGLASTNEGANYFFNGLDDAKAKYYESTLTASAVFTTVLENDAYTALPIFYLVAENDLALPAAYQEGMIALQNSRPGVDIKVAKCPSGHSPHLTWIEGFVAEVQPFGKAMLS